MKNLNIKLVMAMLFVFAHATFAQTQTVGLFINDTANTFHGYTLFAPKHNTMTYLINNAGQKVHEWTASIYPPGQSVYLLENGDLLRTCMVHGQLGSGGGEGGRIEEYNWNDTLVWAFDYSTANYTQHHDIKKLPNGNIIMCVVEKKTVADVIAAGFDTSMIQEPDFHNQQMLLPDAIVEIQPTFPYGGTVVWQWHVWDHLIQSHDATKANYGTPSAHPELIDAAGNHLHLPLFWNHVNSIDYNPALDQIALSVRGNSEVWVIDHSTTTAQAAGHTGGNRGKGGDLIYRWGNPLCYGAGNNADEKYFQQHDVEWIKPGCPGAGDLLCFNNGLGRNYSTIDEITPPVDTAGNYSLIPGPAYGPTNLTWTYHATPDTSLFGHDISGAQRLPNGNTLIDDGPKGTFTEVTYSGTVVWKYIVPVDSSGPMTQGDIVPPDPTHANEYMNAVFRAYRYAENFPGLVGKNLTPGGVIEINTSSVGVELKQVSTLQNYPNPFANQTTIEFSLAKTDKISILIYNEEGQIIRHLITDNVIPEGKFQVVWDGMDAWGKAVGNGVYFYSIVGEDIGEKNGKMVLMR